MNQKRFHFFGFFLLIFVLLLTVNCISGQNINPKFEFRGVWVATVNNIDWPSSPGLSTEQQKQEIIQIVERNKHLGMNAIILQVRPASDAMYLSALEPWSRYLTGVPGNAPEPFYDPLEYWISECHKRGMELHAWLNPFRVAQNVREPLAGNHIAFTHPEWILQYGNLLCFDPGLPEPREFVVRVVKDIVSRYDVDAIHFDDYFYPYPLAEPFPDTTSFALFNRGFLPENKADWRRENVDIMIKMLNDTIKKTKPWVKFGISPFGVWRNKTDDLQGSDTRAGITNYDHLYADVTKWLEMRWIDYLAPQIYWEIGHQSADFARLADWWNEHHYNRAMYVGHALYKSENTSAVKAWSQPQELPAQIRMLRNLPGINGSAFYSSKHFNRDLMGFQDSLKIALYKKPAIVPPMPWIDSIPPEPVKIKKSGKKIRWISVVDGPVSQKPRLYAVYLNEKENSASQDFAADLIYTGTETMYRFERLNKKKKKYGVYVTVFDRLSNESLPSKQLFIRL